VQAGCRLDQRDFGQGIQIRDFDLIHPDLREEPFEVTRATLPDLQAARRAHVQHVGLTHRITGLTLSSHVMPEVRARFNEWSDDALRAFLSDLEKHGLTRFFAGYAASGTVLNQQAATLGVSAAFGSTGSAGFVLISPPGDHRPWQSDHGDPGANAQRALEAAASMMDNVQKLSVGSAAERHLFVYVDEDNYLPWKDLEYGELPNRTPRLTAPITTGWLATTFDRWVLCWVFAPTDGWAAYTFDRSAVLP
jgi:hypothetical protein